jgi:hypothetical protein
MARFLFAWEHGGGLGHAGRLKPLALALRERGHACALQLRDLVQTRHLLGGLEMPLLQAPLWLHQTVGLPQPLVSLPEILQGNGYLQPDHLDALVQGWLSAFGLFGAEAVIGDYAPTAVLAARIAGLPCATLGIGFCMPPAQQPMPAFRDWEPVPAARLARSEAQVLAVVNAVLARHGRAPMARLCELFHGDRPLLCTWPELDHYGRAAEGSTWWGPSFLADTGAGQRGRPQWPEGTGQRVFAYLKAGHPDHVAWLQALVARGCRVLCYMPEVAAGKPVPVDSPLIHYARAPVDLGLALPGCAMLLCHGGEATLVQGLLAGVPVLLLPTQPEQFLISRAVARSGAAVNVAAQPRGTPPARLLELMLDAPGPRLHAREFAARYASFSAAAQTAALVDQFEALLS